MSRRIVVRYGGAVALAAWLAVSLVSACGGTTPSPPALDPGVAKCPDKYAERAPVREVRDGELVAEGAVEALLCVFPFNSQDQSGTYQLGNVLRAAPGDLATLTRYLNDLKIIEHASGANCFLIGHDQYVIALGYAGGNHTLVRIEYGCGTVVSSGAVRQLERVDSLLAYWPDH